MQAWEFGMQQNCEMMKMTYIIISKRMEEQRSKTLLKKQTNKWIHNTIPNKCCFHMPFLIHRGNEQFGYTLLLLGWFKVWPLLKFNFKKKKLVPVHACVVRSLLSNLNCLCWYYHSALVMLARYYYSSIGQAKESVMMTHFQCHQCFSFFNRMRPQSIVNGYHDNDQYKMGPLLSVN